MIFLLRVTPGPSLLSRVGTAAAEVVVQDQEPPNPSHQQMEVNWAERIQPQAGQALQKFGRLGWNLMKFTQMWLPVAILEALTSNHDIPVDLWTPIQALKISLGYW